MTNDETKQQLARATHIIRMQMEEISRLRAELACLLDWANGNTDALSVLQGLYRDPEQSPANRVKAAASALPYERARMPVVQGYVNIGSLAKKLDNARPLVIEHRTD